MNISQLIFEKERKCVQIMMCTHPDHYAPSNKTSKKIFVSGTCSLCTYIDCTIQGLIHQKRGNFAPQGLCFLWLDLLSRDILEIITI